MKLENKFVILTSFYNCEDYVATCIDGTLNQTYTDLGVIFINDASEDSSEDVLFAKITGLTETSANVFSGQQNGKDIFYIRNQERVQSPAVNQKNAVDNYIKDTGTICGIVDGDDHLHSPKAVSYVMENMQPQHLMYQSTQKFAYADGGAKCYRISNKPRGPEHFNQPIVIDGVTYTTNMRVPELREQGWHMNHFRAFRKILSDNVNTGRSFYNPTGELIKPGNDVAYFMPMQDMAGADRVVTTEACHYSYNWDIPHNDHYIYKDKQAREAEYVTRALSGVKYAKGTGELDSILDWANDATGMRKIYEGQGKYFYFTGTEQFVSGVREDGKTGYLMFYETSRYPDGSTGCSTPYDRLEI